MNFYGLVSEQSVYNLTKRHVELEVLPACRAYGVGFRWYSPLAGGVLAGSLSKAAGAETAGGRRSNMKPDKKTREKIVAYEEVCRSLGQPPADVALAWLLHNPVVTAPIIGPRTLAQLENSINALEIRLPEQVYSLPIS